MKDKYPEDTFPTVWENIEKLCKEDRLIAPVEVKKEIEQGDDDLKRWAKSNKKIFIAPNESQCAKVREVLRDFPFLARPNKPGPQADPWLIALAIVKREEQQKTLFPNNYIVVTEESKFKKDRIPAVCRKYNIECISLIELFRKEGWRF
jgi:hypothetical protein